MKHIEDALKKLPEEVEADPQFRQQLRLELSATRDSRRHAHRPAPILGFGLAMACLLLFVIRPDLPRRLNSMVTGAPPVAHTVAEDPLTSMLVRRPGGAMPVTFNQPLAAQEVGIRAVEQERILILRKVILENGERAVVVSELDPPAGKSYRVY